MTTILPFPRVPSLDEEALVNLAIGQLDYHYEDFGWGVTPVGSSTTNDVDVCPVIDTAEIKADITGLEKWPQTATGDMATDDGRAYGRVCFTLTLVRVDEEKGWRVAVYAVEQE